MLVGGGTDLFIFNSKEFIGTGLGFVAGSLFLLLAVVIVIKFAVKPLDSSMGI